MTRDEFHDPEFEERLRGMLHSAADPVQPDPRGWWRLQARLRRRRSATRIGGFALAGVTAALVAVAVLPVLRDQDGDVELGPADVAGQPDGADVAPSPPLEPLAGPVTAGEPVPVAGGIVYSDGSSIHVADLDGTVRSTPAALGVSSQTITDVVVRPGGTTETATIAYRVDGRSDVAPEGCGDIAWVHIPGGGAPDSSGTLTRTGAGAEACLGAPVFASDGSALAWFARGVDGEVFLQTLDWTATGPEDGTLTTFPLAHDALADPEVLALGLPAAGAGSGTAGTLVLRTAADGLLSLPVHRQADGAIALVSAEPEPVAVRDGVPGTVLDTDDTWRAVALPTEDAEPRIGLAYGHPTGTATVETPLTVDATGAPVFLDALGSTVVVGVSGGTAVIARADTSGAAVSVAIGSPALAPVTAAALLEPASGPAGPPPPAPQATPSPTGVPSSTTPPTPTVTATPSTAVTEPPPTPPAQAPAAVTDTAAAIRSAAEARDWAALDARIPDSGFTSNYGGETDHIAFYQQLEAEGTDVLGILTDLLAQEPATRDGSIWVWPREYLDDGYLGWRVGITADGTWTFYVAGD